MFENKGQVPHFIENLATNRVLRGSSFSSTLVSRVEKPLDVSEVTGYVADLQEEIVRLTEENSHLKRVNFVEGAACLGSLDSLASIKCQLESKVEELGLELTQCQLRLSKATDLNLRVVKQV